MEHDRTGAEVDELVNEVAGYVVQRAALAARAARLAYRDEIGQGREDDIDAEGLEIHQRGLALTAAVTIHPRLLDQFASSAASALQGSRRLSIVARGLDVSLRPVEAAIARDLRVLTAAQAHQASLDREALEVLAATRTGDVRRAAEGDALRYLVSMPAPYLLALEREWAEAQRALATAFDQVPPAGVTMLEEQRSEVDRLSERVDVLDDDLSRMQRGVYLAAVSMADATQDEGPEAS